MDRGNSIEITRLTPPLPGRPHGPEPAAKGTPCWKPAAPAGTSLQYPTKNLSRKTPYAKLSRRLPSSPPSRPFAAGHLRRRRPRSRSWSAASTSRFYLPAKLARPARLLQGTGPRRRTVQLDLRLAGRDPRFWARRRCRAWSGSTITTIDLQSKGKFINRTWCSSAWRPGEVVLVKAADGRQIEGSRELEGARRSASPVWESAN